VLGMSESYYILKDGKMSADESTFRFDTKDDMKRLPLEGVTAIDFYGGGSLTTGAINIASKHNIPIHFFGYYGNYIGTFWPKEHYFSGDLTIKQAQVYLNDKKRLELSISLVSGIFENMQGLLKKFDGYLENFSLNVNQSTIEKLMLEEARMRKDYYSRLDGILNPDFAILTRERNPPTNFGNCLISFGNSLLYSEIVTQARKVSLNPSISFYHSAQSGRFSLALDLSEALKPGLVDRLIIQVTRQGIIKPTDEHFRSEGNGILLNERGRKTFITQWEKWLNVANYNIKINRKVSNREKIRFELHKFVKDIEGLETYKPVKLPDD
jgi:CRISPR-associated protein Cas1